MHGCFGTYPAERVEWNIRKSGSICKEVVFYQRGGFRIEEAFAERNACACDAGIQPVVGQPYLESLHEQSGRSMVQHRSATSDHSLSTPMTEATYAREELHARVKADYEAMKPWLPEHVQDILDIGCGYPLIDTWLARHYEGDVTVHLMDGDERIRPIGKNQVGWQKKTQAWKSRHAAVEFLRQEVPECLVEGHPADPSLTIPCDLIISRRAWGHHFSIGMYLDLADRSLRPDGRIITDIRIGTDGIEAFQNAGFRAISPNIELRSVKCYRLVFSR